MMCPHHNVVISTSLSTKNTPANEHAPTTTLLV
jgi:hypothetical protein